MKKHIFTIIACSLLMLTSCTTKDENEIIFSSSNHPSIYIDQHSDELIQWAAKDLATNLSQILGLNIKVTKTTSYHAESTGIYLLQNQSKLAESLPTSNYKHLKDQWEHYTIDGKEKQLFIIGSDVRGTVYGLFEVAERFGISPWDWWADVQPIAKESVSLSLPQEGLSQGPSVRFRGIFLNDEDWGLQPWAANNFEPETNDIGPKTYEKIFQLLLKLKANTIWPAMHHCTKAFYSTKGNKEMAEKYHMFIGTSHAEPMLRNNVDEWDKKKYGDFNYFNNRPIVQKYWQERIDEIKTGNQIYTLGMRGIHDSGMRGSSSQEESMRMVDTIIMDQRKMLSRSLDRPVGSIPQVLIPYKEVLYLYNAGLEVPDDVTLMWTDDNYGYIRRHSSIEEQQRSGGGGVYYHLSYWGRPHDYLWLSTTQPGLIWYEMSRAYHNGAREMWIANVGDIKPAEYNMEFFLDLAWDINSISETTINQHLYQWNTREFGKNTAERLTDIFEEYYRLAMLRKPEFMGWSTTEPTTNTRNTGFTSNNNNELQRRIDNYTSLYEKVNEIFKSIPKEQHDAFFQLVSYPIKSAALMNHKFLYAHQANMATTEEAYIALKQKSDAAFDEIAHLTNSYNQTIADGKWQHMMQMNPRRLPVFKRPDIRWEKPIDKVEKTSNTSPIFIQASNYTATSSSEAYQWRSIEGLGYSGKSMTLFPLNEAHFDNKKPYLEYTFDIEQAGEYELELRLLPTHSNKFDHQIWLEINGDYSEAFNINTKGRSREWKENVLRNYTSVKHSASFDKKGKQQLRVYFNQTGIVLDQIAVSPKDYGVFYEIPN